MREMKSFTVAYDKSIENKGRDSYLKAIKEHIPDAIIADVSKDGMIQDPYKVLFLKPLDENTARNAVGFLERHPGYDIEGVATGRLTITAEAIIRVIGPVKNKTIVIINQSDVLGRPLAKELIERGAEDPIKITSVPTIEVLKDRLKS